MIGDTWLVIDICDDVDDDDDDDDDDDKKVRNSKPTNLQPTIIWF